MKDEASEKHEEFLQDVGNGIDTHTSRMREDILHMLDHHLKKQQRCIKESLEAEAELRERVLVDQRRETELLLADARNGIQMQKAMVQRLIVVLGNTHKQLWWKGRFHDWIVWLLRKRQRRQLHRVMDRSGNAFRAYHVYTQWRLLAAARRQQGLALAEESKWRCREAELLAQVEALKEMVEEERRRSDGLEEKMKTAFVRGVCALNKEAVHVLRGAQELEEPRGMPSQLHDARTILLPSTRTSHTPSTTARFDPFSGQVPGADGGATLGSWPMDTQETYPHRGSMSRQEHHQPCPVHHAPPPPPPPPPGPPCHVCYAPDTCAYNKGTLPHQPFMVSVDPSAVRSYGIKPASQRPPQVTRTAVKTGHSRSVR